MPGEVKYLQHADGVEVEAPSGTTPIVNPTDARGQIIRRGASDLEKLDAKTDNRVLRGDGTDVVLGQIDDPDFFTSDAVATDTKAGIVDFYKTEQFTGTPTSGAGTGASYDIRITRVGKLVSVTGTLTVGGSGSPSQNIVIFTLPDWAKPSISGVLTTPVELDTTSNAVIFTGIRSSGTIEAFSRSLTDSIGNLNFSNSDVVNVNICYSMS